MPCGCLPAVACHLEGPWQIGLGALLPQMSRALAQRASASLRGGGAGAGGQDCVTYFPTKGMAEDRFWFQGWVEAGVPHAQGMGSRVQSQGPVVREILKLEATSERQPGHRAILKGWGLCPEGRGYRSRVWALKSEGKDRGGPRNLACCFLAQYPLNTSPKFQPKFEVGSPKLYSAEPFL